MRRKSGPRNNPHRGSRASEVWRETERRLEQARDRGRRPDDEFLRDHLRRTDRPPPAPRPEHGALTTNTRILAALALAGVLVAGSAALWLRRDTRPEDSGENPVPTEPTAPSAPKPDKPTKPEANPERKRYEYTVDGVIVKSDTVPYKDFMTAYQEAKNVAGRWWWSSTELSVEYGNVVGNYLTNSQIIHGTLAHTEVSNTNPECDSVVSSPSGLSHELVHVLLGPQAQRDFPVVLNEMIASGVETHGNEPFFHYGDLDKPWIQMPIAESMYSGSPLSTPRYAALAHIGRRHRKLLPEIIQTAFARPNLTFENVAEFLAEFGIRHHILTPGKSGEYSYVSSYRDPEKRGYVYVRYKRIKGTSDEFGAISTIQVEFVTAENAVHPLPIMIDMKGLTFIPESSTIPNPAEIRIYHPDGFYSQGLLPPL